MLTSNKFYSIYLLISIHSNRFDPFVLPFKLEDEKNTDRSIESKFDTTIHMHTKHILLAGELFPDKVPYKTGSIPIVKNENNDKQLRKVLARSYLIENAIIVKDRGLFVHGKGFEETMRM